MAARSARPLLEGTEWDSHSWRRPLAACSLMTHRPLCKGVRSPRQTFPGGQSKPTCPHKQGDTRRRHHHCHLGALCLWVNVVSRPIGTSVLTKEHYTWRSRLQRVLEVSHSLADFWDSAGTWKCKPGLWKSIHIHSILKTRKEIPENSLFGTPSFWPHTL